MEYSDIWFKRKSKKHWFPIVKCPKCGKETPLTYRCTMRKGDKTLQIWSTACCDMVEIEKWDILGYINPDDLLKLGFTVSITTADESNKLQNEWVAKVQSKNALERPSCNEKVDSIGDKITGGQNE